MKLAERKMSLLMGLTMSFALSLTGLVSAGQFTVRAFLINFAISFVISMVIGLLVPMGRVNASLCGRLGLRQGGIHARLFESLISDLIYTPVITFCMVTLAYRQAVSHGAPLRYGPMLGRSMVISLVAGYVIIFLVTPLFMRAAMKGVPQGGPGGPGVPGRPDGPGGGPGADRR